MKIKAIFASCLVIALGIILTVHITLIWIHGGVSIGESNKVLLAIETMMGLAIIGFGMERFINSTTQNEGGQK